MKKAIRNVFYPHEGNGNRPYFWHPLSVALTAFLLLALSGLLFAAARTDQDGSTLLADIRSGVIIALTNKERARTEVGELKESETLALVATLKAQDMAAKGYFAHYSPDGTSPWAWFDKAGYAYQRAGENLAVNFDESSDVVRAWMNSPSHRENIVKDGYSEIGIGIAEGTYKGKEATFVVQLFAAPKLPDSSLALTVEKKAPISESEQLSVRGAEIARYSPADALDLLGTEPYLLSVLLLILTAISVFALFVLFKRGVGHGRRMRLSAIVLAAALALSLAVLAYFLKGISISLV